MRTLNEYARLTESALQDVFQAPAEPWRGELYETPPLLRESMAYSALAGGKRLRPAMLLATVEMLGGDAESALIPAAALEMIHTYSLVHDDLPGMDNDTLRRGRPTNHVVYGEGQAILAGDGLLNHAYLLMLWDAKDRAASDSAFNLQGYLEAMTAIAMNAGIGGMIAGQTIDLACERRLLPVDEKHLTAMQLGKTACMFIGAMTAGGYLAGGEEPTIRALREYGRAYGLLFQTVDDILDVESDSAVLGKTVGKDAASGKLTSVSLWGLTAAREAAARYEAEGLAALKSFGPEADFFRDLIRNARTRKM